MYDYTGKNTIGSVGEYIKGKIPEMKKLTYAEYQALSEEEKQRGVYFVPDTPSPGIYVDEELDPDSKNPLTNAAITVALGDKADKSEIPTPYDDTEIRNELADKANKSEIPTSLPADGGNADTVNGHTVESNVPADAVFTDTTYEVFSQGVNGLVPAPTADDVGKFLKGDGTWGEASGQDKELVYDGVLKTLTQTTFISIVDYLAKYDGFAIDALIYSVDSRNTSGSYYAVDNRIIRDNHIQSIINGDSVSPSHCTMYSSTHGLTYKFSKKNDNLQIYASIGGGTSYVTVTFTSFKIYGIKR